MGPTPSETHTLWEYLKDFPAVLFLVLGYWICFKTRDSGNQQLVQIAETQKEIQNDIKQIMQDVAYLKGEKASKEKLQKDIKSGVI